VADARAALEDLALALQDHSTSDEYQARVVQFNQEWEAEVARLHNLEHGPPISQAEVIGAVNQASEPTDVVLCAAGSLPGDLHKLWRTRDPKGYHLEYGYSCMGYEIAGGLGVKMAAPEREVYVMVGDGSYLMMNSEIVTSIQEGYKLTIVLVNNHGFSSIGGLSDSVGSGGFGTLYRYRNPDTGQLDGERLPVDFASHARSLGATVFEAEDLPGLVEALEQSKKQERTTMVVVETDPEQRVPGYESWWDVPVAEVSETEKVQAAYKEYRSVVDKEHNYL
jgi:3D-(3,5/4)-trihydroxycyclohexane-1,2-dione acylhydrolase (decyclizing)